MRRLLSGVLISSIIASIYLPISAYAVVPKNYEDALTYYVEEGIIDPEPISSITTDDGETCTFVYDGENNRIQKVFDGHIISYTYDDDSRLIKESDGVTTIQYTYIDNLLSSIIYSGDEYFYEYDEIGNISALTDAEGSPVCQYNYSSNNTMCTSLVGDNWLENCDPSFIGNINPFRYQGWYYDIETGCYLVDSGIYYNQYENVYIQNDFTVADDISLYANSWLAQEGAELAADYLNSSTFNSERKQVSPSEWDSGKRWFHGLDATEITARCLYGENTGSNSDDDRLGVARVIFNRRAENFYGNSLYDVVTWKEQFSPINPRRAAIFEYSDETANARAAKNKTSPAWKHCVLIACYLSLTSSYSGISDVIDWPDGVDSQLFFYAVNNAYSDGTFKTENGKVYRKVVGKWVECKDVAIAGDGYLSIGTKTIKELLKPYMDLHYIDAHNLLYNTV